MAENNAIFVIQKENITTTLSHLVGIVEKRNAIQQLSHVKIEAHSANSVDFTTTDMDISITTNVQVEHCSINRSFTLPAITLYDIVKKFPAKSLITLKLRDSNIEITSGSVFFALPCLESSDFPCIDEGDLPISFLLSQMDFIQLFSKTKFVIPTEDSRYNLAGLYLHTHDNELRSVTTDGHRLALTIISFDIEKFGILISRKTIVETVKIFEKSEQEIQVFVSRNKIKFICGNTILIAKLIAAEFPKYQDVIPKSYKKIISINKKNLIAAVDRVSAIYIDKSKSVRLCFSDSLRISANNSDSSNAHETLDIDYNGEKLDICFNYTYLLEMLHHVDNSEEVIINFNDNKAAALIENANTIYIIMPMSM